MGADKLFFHYFFLLVFSFFYRVADDKEWKEKYKNKEYKRKKYNVQGLENKIKKDNGKQLTNFAAHLIHPSCQINIQKLF